MSGTTTLYKFMTADHARSSICQKRVKVSLLSELNDPYEMVPAIVDGSGAPIFDAERVRTLMYGVIAEKHGIICMSKAIDDPVMWSHYGDKHRGIALAFTFPENSGLVKVIHRRQDSHRSSERWGTRTSSQRRLRATPWAKVQGMVLRTGVQVHRPRESVNEGGWTLLERTHGRLFFGSCSWMPLPIFRRTHARVFGITWVLGSGLVSCPDGPETIQDEPPTSACTVFLTRGGFGIR